MNQPHQPQAETEQVRNSNQNKILAQIQLVQRQLADNRSGILSRRQRWQYAGVRLAEHLIGLLMVCFGLRTILLVCRIMPDMDAILVGVALLTVVALALYVWRIRPAFTVSVKSVTGKASRRIITTSALLPFFSVTVNRMLFFVTPPQFEAFEDDETYTAYFVERPPRVGGPVLLSVEHVER